MSKMINAVVHSQDNPYRLKMFLESHKKFSRNIFKVSVLYSYSNDDFKEGYDKVVEELKGFNYINTNSLKVDLIDIIKNSNTDQFALFTDEDLFYKKAPNTGVDIINSLFQEHKDLLAFSCRLGHNVKNNKRFKSYNIIIPLNKKSDDHIIVDWSKHYLDFGFPLSTHGHIFRSKELLKLASKVSFNNFDELQENLQIFDHFPKKKMASFSKSILVTDTPPPSQTSDILIRKILNLRLLKNKYVTPKIKVKDVDGIESNFGIYSLLIK